MALPKPTTAVVIALAALVPQSPLVGVASQQPTALKIVVIEGEGAVNIIQQKSAVAPVIEVRDRNDQPVAGATVNFVVRAGRATFSGARTLSVTTNAAGRAVAAGFAPSGTGALQIGASATFQGQTAAAVTIAQTNVMTAAEAAAASTATAGASGSGAGSAAGGAGAGSGGGISATTLTIIGGAIVGGAVVVKEQRSGNSDPLTYSGQFSGVMQQIDAADTNAYSCMRSENQSGTLTLLLSSADTPVQGTMQIDGTFQPFPGNCPDTVYPPASFGLTQSNAGRVNGSRESITAAGHNEFTNTSSTAINTESDDYTFTGHFDGDQQITGVLTIDRTLKGRQLESGYAGTRHGVVTYQVTLHKSGL